MGAWALVNPWPFFIPITKLENPVRQRRQVRVSADACCLCQQSPPLRFALNAILNNPGNRSAFALLLVSLISNHESSVRFWIVSKIHHRALGGLELPP